LDMDTGKAGPVEGHPQRIEEDRLQEDDPVARPLSNVGSRMHLLCFRMLRTKKVIFSSTFVLHCKNNEVLELIVGVHSKFQFGIA
jgi:hypothetical protein